MHESSAQRQLQDATSAAERGDLAAAAVLAARSAERFGACPDGANARALAAACLQCQGRLDEAQEHIDRALEILAPLVALADVAADCARLHGTLVVTVASIQIDRGAYVDALGAIQDLLATSSTARTAADTFAAAMTGGVAAKALGRHADARALYRIAETACEAGELGGEARAALDHNLAGLEHASGEAAAARPHAEAALAWRARQARNATHDRDVAVEQAALAAILVDLDDCEAAAALLTAAIDTFAAVGAHDPLDLGAAHHNLAEGLRRRGDHERARAAFDDALIEKSAALGGSHPEVAVTLASSAAHLAELGHDREARTRATAAVRILASAAPGHPARAIAQAVLDGSAVERRGGSRPGATTSAGDQSSYLV